MKRPRCKTCRHTMKGHKKPKCSSEETLMFSDGSTYIGTVYDGKPSGYGRLIMSSFELYVGEFLDGKRHGKGQQRSRRGIFYDGEWSKDKYHGHGVLRTSEYTYTGKFYNGQYHGHGELTGEESYIGEWSHGNRHGHGTLKNASGTYVGSFYYGLRHGMGMQTDADGSMYTGSWRSGNKHGLGVFTNPIETYTGHWVNNKRHGHGKWESKYLGVYEGQWKRNVRHKRGTHTYIDGSVYTGGWSYGKRVGHGIMNFSDGAVYRGFWLSDEMNGRGTFKDVDGVTFRGEWSNGDREGTFLELVDDKVVAEGSWLCDVRHGGFKIGNERALFLWGSRTEFSSVKKARKAVLKMIAQKDTLSAEEVIRFYPKLLRWSLFNKHDTHGLLVHMLEQTVVDKKFRKHAYELFLAQRYVMIERMFRLCSESLQSQIAEEQDLLFDAMTKEFVANPWVVGSVGYSEDTKQKLLEGLHLGDYGRCPPRNPYTRQTLTASSGKYLSEMKTAKQVYAKMCTVSEKTIETLAFEYNMQDYEQLLQNARAANDRDTIKHLMKERNEFIRARRRLDSADSNDSQNQ